MKPVDGILPTATREIMCDVRTYYKFGNWWCRYFGKYYAHPDMRMI